MVNQLLTRVRLDGVHEFERGLHRMHRALTIFQRGAAGAANAVRSVFTSPAGLIGVAGGAAGIGLMAKSALDASANFERLSRTMQALTGSSEAAAEEMSFIEKFAAASPFKFTDIAEAAVMMRAFGLEIRRTMPYAEALSSAFGPTRQNLMEVVSLFGRLKAGQTGEAMEIARRFGIGRDVLSAAGLQFDKGGQLLSSAEEALSAMERVIAQRFGNIRALMQGTLVVAASNFQDAWERALRALGDAFRPLAVSLLSTVTRFMTFLVDSGRLRAIAEGFARLFRGVADENLLVRGLAIAVAVLESMPDAIEVVWGAFRRFFEAVGTGISQLMNLVGARMTGLVNIFIRALNLFRRFQRLPPLREMEFRPMEMSDLIFGGLFGPQLKNLWQQMMLRTNLIMRDFGYFQRGAGTAGPSLGMAGMPALQPLARIAESTRETAENTRRLVDLRKYALGGGELGEMGVTPVEFARISRDMVVRVEGHAGSTLEQLIQDLVRKSVGELVRRKLL